MADILTGAGLPANNHVTTFGVWQAIRFGDLHPEFEALDEALLWHGEAAQKIQFNPRAALQKAIFLDGYVPNSGEFTVAWMGREYVAQRAEHLGSGEVRVYYALLDDWANVRWVTR